MLAGLLGARKRWTPHPQQVVCSALTSPSSLGLSTCLLMPQDARTEQWGDSVSSQSSPTQQTPTQRPMGLSKRTSGTVQRYHSSMQREPPTLRQSNNDELSPNDTRYGLHPLDFLMTQLSLPTALSSGGIKVDPSPRQERKLEAQDAVTMLLARHATTPRFMGQCFLDPKGYLTGLKNLLGVCNRDAGRSQQVVSRLDQADYSVLDSHSLNKIVELLAACSVRDLTSDEPHWRLSQHHHQPNVEHASARPANETEENFVFFVAAVFGVYSGLLPLSHENPLMDSLPPLMRRRFTDVSSAVAKAAAMRQLPAGQEGINLLGLEHPMFLRGQPSQIEVVENKKYGEWRIVEESSDGRDSKEQRTRLSLGSSVPAKMPDIPNNSLANTRSGRRPKESFTMLDYPQSSAGVTLPFRWQAFALLFQSRSAKSIPGEDSFEEREAPVILESDEDGNPVPVASSHDSEGEAAMTSSTVNNFAKLPSAWISVAPTQNIAARAVEEKDESWGGTSLTVLHAMRLGITARSLLHTPIDKEARYNFSFNLNRDPRVLTKFSVETIARLEKLREVQQQRNSSVREYFESIDPSPMRTYQLSLTVASFLRAGRLQEALHFFCNECPVSEQEWSIPTVVLEALVGKIVLHYTSQEHEMWLHVRYGGSDSLVTEKSVQKTSTSTNHDDQKSASSASPFKFHETATEKLKSHHRVSLTQLLECRARIMTVVEHRLWRAFQLQLPSASSVSGRASADTARSGSRGSSDRSGVHVNAGLLPTAKLFVDLLGEKVHQLRKAPLDTQAAAEASLFTLLRRFPSKTFHESLLQHQSTMSSTMSSFFTHITSAVNHFVLVPTTTTDAANHATKEGDGAEMESGRGRKGKRERGSTEQLMVVVLLPYLEQLFASTPREMLPHKEVALLIDSLINMGSLDVALVLFAYVNFHGKLDLAFYNGALLGSLVNAFKCCTNSIAAVSPKSQLLDASASSISAVAHQIISPNDRRTGSSGASMSRVSGPKLSLVGLKQIKERRLAAFGPDPRHTPVEVLDPGGDWHALRKYLGSKLPALSDDGKTESGQKKRVLENPHPTAWESLHHTAPSSPSRLDSAMAEILARSNEGKGATAEQSSSSSEQKPTTDGDSLHHLVVVQYPQWFRPEAVSHWRQMGSAQHTGNRKPTRAQRKRL